MPKQPMATSSDVTNLEAKLVQDIETAKAAIAPAVDEASKKLSAQIGGLNAKLSDHISKINEKALDKCKQDANKYTDDKGDSLTQAMKAEIQTVMDHCSGMTAKFDQQLKGLEDHIKDLMTKQLQNLTDKFDKLLDEVRGEMAHSDEVWAGEAAKALVEQNHQLSADIKNLCKKAEADDVRQGELAKKDLNDFLDTQHERDLKQDERQNRQNAEIYIKIKELQDKVNESIEKLRAETSETHCAHVEKHEEHVAKTVDRLVTLEDDTNSIRNAISEVENQTTRRVDWVIKNVSKRIRPLSPSRAMLHTSWFSPKFDAAGAYGMQLELQLFRKADPPVDGEDAGDVAIHLWACKGMTLAYKLACGNKSVVLNKTFNGRVPYGTKRFCFIQNEINKEDDTLRVSVEILEAVRDIEHVVKPPPEPIEDPSAPPKTLEELEAEKQIKAKALEGSMFFKRTINNRLYDQVKEQVHVLQSRMVRKVEWRVEHASLLRQCFPPDECICSTAFSAAGVDGMQFIFYPSGYKGCTEGYCSLFLFGPAGSTLKCWLVAGGQKRDASHTFIEPGAFGRTNFCRFESCVDETEDCILIALDIEDAQQDIVAHVKHPAVQPGDKRTLQQIEGSSDKTVQSVVKLTKRPGQKATGKDADLVELRVLPSLWTAQQLGTVSPPSDGMNNMEDIKIRAQSGSSRRRPDISSSMMKASTSTILQSSTMHASSSLPTMPSLRDARGRPAIEQDLPPRKPFSSTHGEIMGPRKLDSRRGMG